ncbi:MAG TPA: YfcE family phosphodiesterase [Pirellulales bacterium]|nr:YfcE family phosphodiesterase [Pirellulales bacterium]
MFLGVVSDTHGDIPRTRAAVQMLESLEVGLVLHCGDIGTPEIISLFARWPTHFVFGNCDSDRKTLALAIERAGQACHGVFGELELEGRRIAFLHGDDSERLSETIDAGRWDLVCHGHTHVVRQERRGGTLILNPGAVHRANPHTIAIVELPELAVNVVTIG